MRAIRLEGGAIAEARLDWSASSPGSLAAGMVGDARLIARSRGSTRGTAEFANGRRALVSRLPGSASEGAMIRLQITRPEMAESGRIKLAHARPTAEAPRPAPSLAETLAAEGWQVRKLRHFPEGDWDALMADAFAGQCAFPGGALVISPTPAMTLIDIDGELPPRTLALAACEPIARVLRRFDIGGSTGVDFPTLPEKADRRAVDMALEEALAGWPHERTAMNGFGFVQLVSRLERPSILHRACFQRPAAAARLLLRRAEKLAGPGLIELVAHPALARHLRPDWLAELNRRTGRNHRLRLDPALAIESPHAQLVGS